MRSKQTKWPARQVSVDQSAGGPRLSVAALYRCAYTAFTMHSTGQTVTHFGES
jgi:hypothetical protein